MVNKIQCLKCKKEYKLSEKFFDLSVNFNESSLNKQTKIYDLKKMIQYIFRQEELDSNNKYYCESCKEFVEKATKETYLKKLPPYLMITINRFCYNL